MVIGPSTKETSLHHFRDPLLEVVSKDTDVDLMGVMLVGSPDGNEDKMLVGTRAAVWAECMRADGVILSCDGWGNSHVDYTNTMEQIGTRGIPVTGITFNGTVAQFVVVNDYLDGVVDMNKSASGEETNVVGENNMTERDCKLALAKLKLKMRQKEQKNREKMTVKYRVKTKHTKELLKEFVKFSFRVNHPKTTLRLFVIGVGFLIRNRHGERLFGDVDVSGNRYLVVYICICKTSYRRDAAERK